MKKTLLSMLGLMTANLMSAQVYITDIKFDANGVNNDGLVVGSQDQNQPILLWNPFDNTYTNIGGISAGNGIGGVARFSGDGKFVAAPMPYDAIPLNSEWERGDYPDFAYTYNDIIYITDFNLFAIGTSDDGKTGIILRSANQGTTWQQSDDISAQKEDGTYYMHKPEGGIQAFAPLSYYQILAGGKNGVLYFSSNGCNSWSHIDIQPKDDDLTVDTYWTMDFMYSVNEYGGITSETAVYGAVGVEYTDGSYAVWYTTDSGDSFAKATGVSGVPAYITHIGDLFFMATQNGHIQKSVDYGKTWTDVFATKDNSPLYRIRFADSQRGIATSDNVVYITKDGGETWKQTEVLPVSVSPVADETVNIKWNDATWVGDTLAVAGTGGNMYLSVDGGTKFTKQEVDDEAENDYGTVFYHGGIFNLIAQDGRFYHKTVVKTQSGYLAGIYDIENETWTPLASTGYFSGDVASAPWQFSGDGKTVVGNVYNLYKPTNQVQAHAAAMTVDNYTDLGSKFADINRASSSLGVSYDASVIVGWQDIWGPRFGTVWTRNADGSYTQKMMLKDPNKNEDDIDYMDKEECYESLVATARSVSPDGKWIGGDGSATSAFKGPWLWNEEEGYMTLFGDEDVSGGVAAVANNGEKAIGWQGIGSSAWLYEKGKGVTYLQDYATDVLGCDLGDFYIVSVYDMSPNGRYVTGYGMRGLDVYGYMIDLQGGTTSIENKIVEQVKASVYPNPVADELHIDMPFDSGDVVTKLTLVDMQGRVVRRIDTAHQSNTMDVANLSEGIYVLDVNARGTHKSFKIMVKH